MVTTQAPGLTVVVGPVGVTLVVVPTSRAVVATIGWVVGGGSTPPPFSWSMTNNPRTRKPTPSSPSNAWRMIDPTNGSSLPISFKPPPTAAPMSDNSPAVTSSSFTAPSPSRPQLPPPGAYSVASRPARHDHIRVSPATSGLFAPGSFHLMDEQIIRRGPVGVSAVPDEAQLGTTPRMKLMSTAAT